jgi:WD40 repeat protein
VSKNIGEKQATNGRPVQSNGSVLDGQTRLLNPSRIPTLSSSPVERTNDIVFVGERYALYGERARGGLGRILEARDLRLDRTVAVKELLGRGEEAEARFVREALITARLQHPAIIPLYDFGQSPTGKPFYAMKMVEGRSLAEVVKSKRTMAERLELLPNIIAVADAIAYAHGRGVIHRDLKPSNVLIGPFGETVVIDWGLAADLSEGTHDIAPTIGSSERPSSGLTVAGTVMGTPEYMPPEQAEGKIVDERADVYAIGAILYYVLCGAAPYKGNSSSEVLTALARKHPVPLEEKEKTVPQELATIVRKAMSRIPQERYPTARELAEDLKRFQTGQLVGAHQYSKCDLMHRWLAKNRTLVIFAALFLCFSTISGVLTFRRIIRERDRAELLRATADRARASAEARNAQLALERARASLDRDPTAVIAWLKTFEHLQSHWELVASIATDAVSRGVSRHVFHHREEVTDIAFSNDGEHLASVGEDKMLHLWNLRLGKHQAQVSHEEGLQAVVFSATTNTIASAGHHGVIRVSDFKGTELHLLRGHRPRATIRRLTFSPDGEKIASASDDGTVRIWSLVSGASEVLRAEAPVSALSFSPDAKLLAFGAADGSIRVYERPLNATYLLGRHFGRIRDLAFSPSGALLASSSDDSTIRVWNTSSRRSRTLRGHDREVGSVAFSPDGSLLASASFDNTVRLWNLRTGGQKVLLRHDDRVKVVAFSPDGALLASGGSDSVVRIANLRTLEMRTLLGHTGSVNALRFSADGNTLASAGLDKSVRLWDMSELRSNRSVREHRGAVWSLDFNPDGSRIATAGGDNSVGIWDIRSDKFHLLPGHENVVLRVLYSRDGTQLASSSFDGTIRIWNGTSGEHRVLNGHTEVVANIAFSPDGRNLASVSEDGNVRLWDVGAATSTLLHHYPGGAWALAFSANGRWIASGAKDGRVHIHNTETGQQHLFRASRHAIKGVLFSLDANLLFTNALDNSIRIWHVPTLEERLLRDRLPYRILLPATPNVLLSGSRDSTVQVLTLSGESHLFEGHMAPVSTLAFEPGSSLLASGSEDRTIRLWHLQRGAIRVLRGHAGLVTKLAFSPDATFLASSSVDHTVRLWPVSLASNLPDSPGKFREWLDRITTVSQEPLQLSRRNREE